MQAFIDNANKPEEEETSPYLTLTNVGSQTGTASILHRTQNGWEERDFRTVEYRTSGADWTPYAFGEGGYTSLGVLSGHVGEEIEIPAGGSVQFRNSSGICGAAKEDLRFRLNGSDFKASGDLQSMLDYRETYDVVPQSGFSYMFADCARLVDASGLNMDMREIQGSGCFQMFYNCASLVAAPKLPAETLGAAAYQQMFSGCAKLAEMPGLPATALTNGNEYNGMFYGCASLTSTADLPAVSVAAMSYYNMFYGCTSLVRTGRIALSPAGKTQYQMMFYSCPSLAEVTFTGERTFQSARMFSGVAAEGVVKYTNHALDAQDVPSGWTLEYIGD